MANTGGFHQRWGIPRCPERPKTPGQATRELGEEGLADRGQHHYSLSPLPWQEQQTAAIHHRSFFFGALSVSYGTLVLIRSIESTRNHADCPSRQKRFGYYSGEIPRSLLSAMIKNAAKYSCRICVNQLHSRGFPICFLFLCVSVRFTEKTSVP